MNTKKMNIPPIAVQANSKVERNSNLELLRIVSILLIIAMHVCGYAASKGDFSLGNTYIRYFIGSIGNLGVSCFVLISGYFGVKFSWKKLVYISLLTTVYACLASFCNEGFTVNRDCIMQLTVVPRYFNWYITCYIILMMLSSYLNRFCESLERKSYRKLLLALFVMMSVLPMMVSATETVAIRSGQCLSYFIYAYLIGRYIRLHHDSTCPLWKPSLVVAGLVLFMWMFNVATLYIPGLGQIPITSNYSPTIIIASVASLYLFKSFTFRSRTINYISASVLAIYLLDWMKPTIDLYIEVYQHTKDPDFIVYLIVEVCAIAIVAIVIDKIRIHLLYKPEAWMTNKLVSVCEKMNAAINKII